MPRFKGQPADDGFAHNGDAALEAVKVAEVDDDLRRIAKAEARARANRAREEGGDLGLSSADWNLRHGWMQYIHGVHIISNQQQNPQKPFLVVVGAPELVKREAPTWTDFSKELQRCLYARSQGKNLPQFHVIEASDDENHRCIGAEFASFHEANFWATQMAEMGCGSPHDDNVGVSDELRDAGKAYDARGTISRVFRRAPTLPVSPTLKEVIDRERVFYGWYILPIKNMVPHAARSDRSSPPSLPAEAETEDTPCSLVECAMEEGCAADKPQRPL